MNNATDSPDTSAEPPSMFDQFYYYWWYVIPGVAIAANFIVVFTLSRVDGIVPSTTRCLFIHQNVVEMGGSIIAIFTHHFRTSYSPDATGVWSCFMWSQLYWMFDGCAQLNVTLVTIERYFAVCFVFKRVFTTKRILCLIVIIDLLAVFVNGYDQMWTYFVAADGMCYRTVDGATKLSAGLLSMLLLSLPPICAIIICYPLIFHAIRCSAKMHASAVGKCEKSTTASLKVLRTALITGVLLIISNVPDMVIYTFMSGMLNMFIIDAGSSDDVQVLTTTFKSFLPIAHSLVYSMLTPRFRQAFFLAITHARPSFKGNRF